MVKDECDIIELFVRINLRFVDRMYIIDNNSSDATVEIIEKLQSEECPVTLWHDDSVDFQQSLTTISAVRRIADEYGPDWIIPLDADEFITENGRDLRSELENIPEKNCGLMEWRTFVPLTCDYATLENPLWQNFRQRAIETVLFDKVVIPAHLAQQTLLPMGNHFLMTLEHKNVPSCKLSATLAHVPVRSPEQIVTKSIIGSIKHRITWDRKADEGFHKDLLADFIRKCRYSPDTGELQEMAFSYSQKPGEPVIRETDADKRVGTIDDCIRYKELSVINTLERFDRYMIELSSELHTNNSRNRITKSSAHEIERLKTILDEKEKELRFFKRTALGKGIARIVTMLNHHKKSRKYQAGPIDR